MHSKTILLSGLLATSQLFSFIAAEVGTSPHQERAAVVKVVTNVNTVTKHVTVTVRPGQAPSTPAPAPPRPQPNAKPQDNQNGEKPKKKKQQQQGNGKPRKPKQSNGPADPPGYAGQAAGQQLPKHPGTSYQQRVLHHHNIHRANHSAPPMTWSPALAATARKIAATCSYGHNTNMDGGGYGQNIATGTPPKGIGKVITGMFYNGEVGAFAGRYGQEAPQGFEHWGHFSQVVWKASTEVGCATQDCHARGLANSGSNVAPFFTVCIYRKPGNFGGQYAQNIGRPLGRKTVRV